MYIPIAKLIKFFALSTVSKFNCRFKSLIFVLYTQYGKIKQIIKKFKTDFLDVLFTNSVTLYAKFLLLILLLGVAIHLILVHRI